MNMSLFAPYLLFCIVMTSTPGPNNALVILSGARFGIYKTVPLILGIAFGVAVQLFTIGIGLNQIFLTLPQLQFILGFIGFMYILWLAWKIASSGPLNIELEQKPSMGFLQGALFQWVNPKAWIISISTVSTYFALNPPVSEIIYAALILMLVSIPCVGIWAVSGLFLRQHLIKPQFAFIFNITMAIALLVSVLPTALRLMSSLTP
ncbi:MULTISPECIES: LysE family translocator [unclassified Acinetobacter]|jgi:threonine/homoserine/homoserine lactone efflux protein|uniref:LysE family translocator n=1 Tax=unclassified Acinetobacter TaxID=196816 RepID=UPI000DA6BD3F|nr:LysE family translocator [Acinetobacter sp. WCHAc060042]